MGYRLAALLSRRIFARRANFFLVVLVLVLVLDWVSGLDYEDEDDDEDDSVAAAPRCEISGLNDSRLQPGSDAGSLKSSA